MERDAAFLLSLTMLAAAAITVGVSGWVLFARGHRVVTASAAPVTTDPPPITEES